MLRRNDQSSVRISAPVSSDARCNRWDKRRARSRAERNAIYQTTNIYTIYRTCASPII